MKPTKQPPGTERHRDEQRDDDNPKVAGRSDWTDADERGEKRFGVTRVDDADPSELDPEDQEDVEDTDIESGGEQGGMRRGEKPRKDEPREP